MAPALLDRHVVVTGATGELGAAVARDLAARGATCHLPVRSAPAADRLATEGPGVLRVVAGVDVSDPRAVEAFYADLPGLWASVHCVGAFAAAPIEDTRAGDLERMLQVNLLTAFSCSRAAVLALRRRGGGGRIVNVGALAGLEPHRGAGMTAYATSKAAVAAFSLALAEEVKGDGILVNALAPSTLDTKANRAGVPAAEVLRWPTLADVAVIVAGLIAPDQAGLRGAVLPVQGRA